MNGTVWELPCRSQEFREGPLVSQGPATLTLAYDFETETGDYAWEQAQFSGVAAFTFTAAVYCNEEQIGAYDRLEVVAASHWAADLRAEGSALRHYRIYFDDVGCYEVLASAFVPPSSG